MNTEDLMNSDASMWALIEQASYLPVYLHLEQKYPSLLLSNGIVPDFQISAKKERCDEETYQCLEIW